MREVEDLSGKTSSLINFYYSDRFPKLHEWMMGKDGLPLRGYRVHGWEICKHLGKPNCFMQGYESYPAVWVYYDDHGITWVIFSDGVWKKHYKGTSYEVAIPDNITEEEFKTAINEFFTHFGFTADGPT